MDDRSFRILSLVGSIVFGAVILLLVELRRHHPDLRILVGWMAAWSAAGIGLNLVSGRVGSPTIVKRAEHPDIFWARISENFIILLVLALFAGGAAAGFLVL